MARQLTYLIAVLTVCARLAMPHAAPHEDAPPPLALAPVQTVAMR